jgi:hypothetical protein
MIGNPTSSLTSGPCGLVSNCSIIDWRLKNDNSSALLDRSATGSLNTVAQSFQVNANCPPQVNGNEFVTSIYNKSFLKLAFEEVDLYDGIGNDDGLCEDNEKCIFSPNFGSFQGEGSLTSECTFVNGTTSGSISGVSLRAFSQYFTN